MYIYIQTYLYLKKYLLVTSSVNGGLPTSRGLVKPRANGWHRHGIFPALQGGSSLVFFGTKKPLGLEAVDLSERLIYLHTVGGAKRWMVCRTLAGWDLGWGKSTTWEKNQQTQPEKMVKDLEGRSFHGMIWRRVAASFSCLHGGGVEHVSWNCGLTCFNFTGKLQ